MEARRQVAAEDGQVGRSTQSQLDRSGLMGSVTGQSHTKDAEDAMKPSGRLLRKERFSSGSTRALACRQQAPRRLAAGNGSRCSARAQNTTREARALPIPFRAFR